MSMYCVLFTFYTGGGCRGCRAKKKYVYKTTLSKEYGLTPKLIKELDPPDKEVINMHWKSGPPAYLYDVARVEDFIDQNKERVEKERRLREKLSAAGSANYRKPLEKEIAEVTEWAESISIHIYASTSDLDRICPHGSAKAVRAQIRHEYTNYDFVLQGLYEYRSDIQEEVYPLIKERFEDAVEAAIHNWEVERQSCLTTD